MTCPFWVALHGMAYSFFELDRAVVHAEAWPRGATPHLRSGQWPRVPGCDGAGMAKRSYPKSEARGGGREEQPLLQGVVAARAQEGLEELSHAEGQEGWQ